MRQNRTHGWPRLTALVLALALLLTGCATPAAEGSTPEDSAPIAATSETPGDESGDAGETGTEEPVQKPTRAETPVSGEDAELLARTGLAEGELVEISTEEAGQIDRTAAGMWAAYAPGPNGEDPLVESRDWDRYTSPLGVVNLASREAAFYDRLNKTCLKYLRTSGLDGVRYSYSDGSVYYATEGVKFSDLGLSKKQTYNVYCWFRYNHPQYYFLASSTLSDSYSLYPCIFEIMSDGEKRAEITNELFDKLEGWIQDIEGSASTTYQKELHANNLLCEQNTYEPQYERPNEGGLRYDQSLYSSVLLENTVCAGYAMAFCAMMNAMGVDTTAGLSDSHAWNVVHFDDGNFYAVDVCWNDTDGRPPYRNDYLNAGEEIMFATNSRKESHTYSEGLAAWIPAIAKEGYTPTGEESQQSLVPQNLQVFRATSTSISLAWDLIDGVRGYEIAIFDGDEPTHYKYTGEMWDIVSSLTPNTDYRFGVRSFWPDNGENQYSDWAYITATTANDSTGRPAVPSNFKAAATEVKNEVLLTWDPVPGASVYDTCAYRDATYTEIIEGSLDTYPAGEGEYTSWFNLRPGTTYYFGVRAGKTVDGETLYSDWVNLSYTNT